MKSETALGLASPLSPRRQSCYSNASAASDAARRRLLSVKGDPFLLADWECALFMHFVLAPEVLRPYVPEPFELELHEGRACVSVVALTMRRFRACRRAALAWLLRPVAQQRFLNVRTYVRWRDEPGALFLWGWLSKPFRVGLPGAMFGLPYAFATLDYDHQLESGLLRGVARVEACSQRFAYRAAIDRKTAFQPCPAGSLAEFAMERYTGLFWRGGRPGCRLRLSWSSRKTASSERDSRGSKRRDWRRAISRPVLNASGLVERIGWNGQPARFVQDEVCSARSTKCHDRLAGERQTSCGPENSERCRAGASAGASG